MKYLSKRIILAGCHKWARMGVTWKSQTASPGPSAVFPAEPKGRGGKGLGERQSTVDGNMDFGVLLPRYLSWFHLCDPRQMIQPC